LTDLERLIATDAIRELQARYVRAADEKRWSDLAALFTSDATFVSQDVDGTPVVEMSGRKEIEEIIGGSVGSARPIHHLFSYEIEIESPTAARGVFSMEDIVTRPDDEPLPPAVEGGPKPFRSLHGYGHYHVRYQATDGKWLIAEIVQTRLQLDFTY
jgi:hypothetical protein